MKKTFTALSVLAAVICCTLAFAVNRHGALPKLLSFGNSTTESAAKQDKHQKKFDGNIRLDPSSIKMAMALMEPQSKFGAIAKAYSLSESGSEGEHIEEVDLLTSNQNLRYIGEVSLLDIEGRQVQFSTAETDHVILAGIDESGYLNWYSVSDVSYVFSGHIAAADSASVYPCIIYQNNNDGFSVRGQSQVTLCSENEYSSDFYVEASFPGDGTPLAFGFIVANSSAENQFTATDLRYYYTRKGLVPEKWTSENDLAGLGIQDYMADNAYILKCQDGVTTLGLYYNGSAYVTGINTTATEVAIPENIYLDGRYLNIQYFGNGDPMSWAGAPLLTSLDLGSVSEVNADFSGSALTDLYIHGNCWFVNTNDLENIYLHIPYNMNRGEFDYCGFKRVLVGAETPDCPVGEISNWVVPGDEEGDYFGIRLDDGYFWIAEIFTDKESVTLPIGTPYMEGLYYIHGLGRDSYYGQEYLCRNAPNLKSVTIPDNYQEMDVVWTSCPITELHMQGDVPNTYWPLSSNMTVYVSNRSYFSNYESNDSWNSASIQPEGWEFEWMTIDVKRKGEFAQTYIEMTDADWSLGTYVKVTGTLNATDLGNIKNLTNLRKLDLSEAVFEGLPDSFLRDEYSLTEVILPENVTAISNSAFYNCQNLTNVVAYGIESVGTYAFNNCNKLKTFDISKVKSIGNSAFSNCNVYNPEAFSDEIYAIGNSAFYNTGITELTLPETMRTLGSSAFSYCSQLAKVVLPSSITAIYSSTFSYCANLAEINLPEGITTVDYEAFIGCRSLTEITIPSTVQSMGSDVFENCSSLTTVKCKAIVPPVANSVFTNGMDLNHCTLYVAPFAVDAYREAMNWSNFYIMKPLNEPVKNIYINRPMTFDLLSEDNAVLQENPNMTLDYDNSNVGQLSASGDGTLSAGIFKIFHNFGRRDYRYRSDYRTTLVNDAENMRADSVMCSIDFEKNYWHFISFQYDVKMEDIFGLNGTDFVIRQYNAEKRALGADNTSNWEDVPADGTLKAGKGYIIQAANNGTNENGNTYAAIVRFPSRNTTTKNNLFTNNNVIVPLDEYAAEFAHNRSWNLVGNPYPCYYDMHALMDDFTTPITLWRGSSYQAYSPVDDDIILRPNEAFFVQRPLDAEQMTFGAEGRMHYAAAVTASNNATPGINYAPAVTAQGTGRSVFNFTVDGCGSNDRARIVMNEAASMNYEIERDASKFFAEIATGAELYVDGNVQYSICERPFDNGEALLGLRLAQKGEYTISLAGRDTEGWSVMLTDNATGVTVDLTETPYAFQSEAGDFQNRFTVRFQKPGISGVESVTGEGAEGDVQVVNAAGIVVFNGCLDDFKATAQPGVYVVVSKEKTAKIVVK